MRRGSCGTSLSAPSLVSRFPNRLCWPSPFRDRVGWVTQEHPSEFLLAEPGIPCLLSRRTRLRNGSWRRLIVLIVGRVLHQEPTGTPGPREPLTYPGLPDAHSASEVSEGLPGQGAPEGRREGSQVLQK